MTNVNEADLAGKRRRNAHNFDREQHDHYVEEPWCSDRLFDVERFEGPITDPCCGFGNIMQSAKAHGYEVDPRDITDRGFPSTKVADFLLCRDELPSVVFNPPYGVVGKGASRVDQMEAFCRRAAEVAWKAAVFVPLARLNAAWPWLSQLPLARVWLLTPRPSCPPGSYILAGNKPEGGRVDFCWLIFERGFQGTPTFWWLHEKKTVQPKVPTTMTDVTDTLKEADRVAARLLCECPTIDMDNRPAVLEALSYFGDEFWTHQEVSNYGYANIYESVRFQRHLAQIASKSWRVDELHREASKLYDLRKGPEAQSADFYHAQAQYQLVKLIHDGQAQPQPQNARA